MNFEEMSIEDAVVVKGGDRVTLLWLLGYCLVAGLTLTLVVFALA